MVEHEKPRLEIHIFSEMGQIKSINDHKADLMKSVGDMNQNIAKMHEAQQNIKAVKRTIQRIEEEKIPFSDSPKMNAKYHKTIEKLQVKHSKFNEDYLEGKGKTEKLQKTLDLMKSKLGKAQIQKQRANRLRKYNYKEVEVLNPSAVLIEGELKKSGANDEQKANPFHKYAKKNELPVRGLKRKREHFEWVGNDINEGDGKEFVETAKIHRHLASLAYDNKFMDSLPGETKVVGVLLKQEHWKNLSNQHFKEPGNEKSKLFHDTQLLFDQSPYNVSFVFHEAPNNKQLKELFPKVSKLKKKKRVLKQKIMKKVFVGPKRITKKRKLTRRKRAWRAVKSLLAKVFPKKK